MANTYLEEKGPALLERIGMSKAEFARRMGIKKQNVNVLFKSKNLDTIHRASVVMNIPLALLIGYTSEPDLIPQDALFVKEEDIPLAFGFLGNVYMSFKGRPKEAFWFLINRQEGDARSVFTREDIGDIDLIWGDENCGVRHILVKHINERDFPTVNQMIDEVTSIILNGRLSFNNPDKAILQKDGYIVAIRKNYRIDGKKLETQNWVLTAYSKKSSDTTRAPLDTD